MDIVITTIFPPSEAMKSLAHALARQGGVLWVMGDRKGPLAYEVPGARFYSIEDQLRLPFHLAPLLPEKHYARKNLGYLLVQQQGAPFLVETDDDNAPLDSYWQPRQAGVVAELAEGPRWRNVYRDFSEHRLWPRGFPLEEIQSSFVSPPPAAQPAQERDCLIQQGLADGNPDIDAVYRLTGPLPIHFRSRPPLALAPGCWCPFNSQNTTFFRAAFPLLYLPSYCSFRMTDIWRSLVAQRCLWEMESHLCFFSPTVVQDRNEHRLLRDFEDEIPGYLLNDRLRGLLENLRLARGRDRATVSSNLGLCYETLVQAQILPERELPLVQAWIQDVASLGS